MAFRRSIQSEQRKERQMTFEVNADAVSPAILVGSPQATLSRAGVGDYSLTFSEPYARACTGLGCGLEDNAIITIGTRSTTAIQILVEDASSNAAADLDFVVQVVGWDAEDES